LEKLFRMVSSDSACYSRPRDFDLRRMSGILPVCGMQDCDVPFAGSPAVGDSVRKKFSMERVSRQWQTA